jgi:hypothetical protein
MKKSPWLWIGGILGAGGLLWFFRSKLAHAASTSTQPVSYTHGDVDAGWKPFTTSFPLEVRFVSPSAPTEDRTVPAGTTVLTSATWFYGDSEHPGLYRPRDIMLQGDDRQWTIMGGWPLDVWITVPFNP